MAFLRKDSDEDYEEELSEKVLPRRAFRDLKPENTRKRKEPPKPWGKKERVFILLTLILTAALAAFLTFSSAGFVFKLPKISAPTLSGLGETTIVIEGRKEQRERAERIKSEFQNLVLGKTGSYAFAVLELTNGFSFGAGEEEIFPAASLNKLPVLAALYREAESGNLDLDTTHKLAESEKQSGAGSLSQSPAGTQITFKELARLMGKVSDNTALVIVVNELGLEKINKMTTEIGMTKTRYLENETTAKDIAIFFKRLWREEIVSQEFRDQILDFLTDTVREDLISGGVSESIRVAHKFGTLDNVLNDAGIVFAPNPYVLVVLSKNANLGEAAQVISQFSKTVYTEMTK